MKKSLIVLCLIMIGGQVYSQRIPVNQKPIIMSPVPASMDYKSTMEKWTAKSTGEITNKSFYKSKSDWQLIIDTTWGPGLPLEEKLDIFDSYTTVLTAKFDGFNSLGIDLDMWSVKLGQYRESIDESMSKGAFAALMSHLAFDLSDVHTSAYDDSVNFTPLNVGTPIIVANSATADHFGAVLTPLPDSSLLVLRAIENHPLDLVAGDIVLGYEGVAWKDLYVELLDAGLPVFGLSRGAVSAKHHNLLRSAGLNWHLFDTIDIKKYGSADIIHLSVIPLLQLPATAGIIDYTNSLISCEDCLMNNEQLPVSGIELPKWQDLKDRSVNYGIIEGTNIGYIYLYIEIASDDEEFDYTTDKQLLEAVEALKGTESLVIDIRQNFGGWALLKQGLSYLFNNVLTPLSDLHRCNSSDFSLCRNPDWEQSWKIPGNANTIYDRPIAILVGPNCASMGEITAYRFANHPMVKFFGKPMCGSMGDNSSITDFSGWTLQYSRGDMFEIKNPDIHLNHREFPVDEPVWFNADDVAAGEDPIVNSALEWMQNLSFAHDVNLKYKALPHGSEYIQEITAVVENPNSNALQLYAKITNSDGTLTDSVNLFDDGQHRDSAADDGIWGVSLTPEYENSWNVDITTNDIDAGTTRTLKKVASYQTIGPIEADYLSIIGKDTIPNPGDTLRLNLTLANRGKLISASKVEASLSSLDPFAKIDTGMLSIPIINPGRVRTYLGNIDLVISENCPVDYEIPVKIDIYSYGNAFWSDTLKIMVQKGVNTGQSDIQHIRVYPNPARDRLHIDIADNGQQKTLFDLYDIFGRLILKQTLSESQVLDISHLKTGMYLYRLQNGSDKRSGKLIKK
jgi:hypothetical protein